MFDKGKTPYFYHNNHLGTPLKLTDKEGNVVWSSTYTAFGKAEVTVEKVTNNLRFPGQYFDKETGSHYNMHRYYEPDTGRYITADPIGLQGGINLYAYVAGKPVSWIDPSGLRPLSDSEKEALKPFIPQRDLDKANIHVGDMPFYAPDWAAAITRGNDIYFSDPNQTFNTPADLALLGHELVHVGQYADGMTWFTYIWECAGDYENCCYENEAREMERRIRKELNQK